MKKDESLLEWLIPWQNDPKPIDSASGVGLLSGPRRQAGTMGKQLQPFPRPQPSTVTQLAETGQEMALEFMS